MQSEFSLWILVSHSAPGERAGNREWHCKCLMCGGGGSKVVDRGSFHLMFLSIVLF